MTNSTAVQIVQFVHPGFEYHRPEHVGVRHSRSGVMDWKPGNSKHDRKFIVSCGSLFEPNTERDHRDVSIVFWGEWEGPSVYWRIEVATGKPKPSVMHAPFRPDRAPVKPVQNTDPMVFGDAFIYSNCLQQAFPTLTRLSKGSIVLFGRHSRAAKSFSLDTCLIVDHVEQLKPLPFNASGYGKDILNDAVLNPLSTEGKTGPLAVYFGRMRTVNDDSPFSFFPARLFGDLDRLFARPRLLPTGPLKGVISPEKPQGIKSAAVNMAQRDAIWREVVRQVVHEGCGLGYSASAPPVVTSHTAEAAALRAPAPFV